MKKISKSVAALTLVLALSSAPAIAFPGFIENNDSTAAPIDRYRLDNPYKEFSGQPNVRDKGSWFGGFEMVYEDTFKNEIDNNGEEN